MPEERNLVAELRAPGGRLCVEFEREDDRYGHRIVSVDAEGRRTTLLGSIEGHAGGAPPSPAFQGLNIDQLRSASTEDAPLAAMLTGIAREGHWSASVQSVGGETNLSDAFELDVACRVKRSPPELRSTYSLADVTITGWNDRLVEGSTHGVAWRLRIEPNPTGTSPNFCRLERRNQCLAIVYEPAMNEPTPLTLRWRYRVELMG